MNRRNLLIAAVSLPGVAWLGGCSQVSQIASDATTIANGVSAVLPTIQTLLGAGSTAYTVVTNAVASVKAAAAMLSSEVGGGVTTAGTALKAGVDAIAAALANYTLPAWVSTVIQAAQTLAPVAIGLISMAATPPGAMTPAQARAILTAAAAAS